MFVTLGVLTRRLKPIVRSSAFWRTVAKHNEEMKELVATFVLGGDTLGIYTDM